MIRETRFEVPLGNKWFAKRALKSRSETNDSRNALWSPARKQMIRETRFESPAPKQMIRETRFEVPLWNKWFAKRVLKSR